MPCTPDDPDFSGAAALDDDPHAAAQLNLLERVTLAGAWSLQAIDVRPGLPATGGPIQVSAMLARLLGIDPALTGGIDDLLPLYADEARPVLLESLQQCLAGTPFELASELTTGDGRLLWVRTLAEPRRAADGRITHLQGVVQDITAQRDAEQASRRLTMRLGTTLASITDAFMTLDSHGRFTYVNAESERLLRRSGAELLGQTLWHALTTQDGQGGRHAVRLQKKMQAALQSGQNLEFEAFYAVLGKWLELRAYPFDDGLAVYVRDVTARKTAKDEIEHLAFYDPLTQLPNRQLLMDRLNAVLSQAPAEAQAPAPIGALMFIDLDHFKVLNDTLGHARGDLLLQRVAERLSRCVPAGDTVARLGGDEFVVMLPDLGADREVAISRARAVGETILGALSEPFNLAGNPHHATCSVGITSFTRQRETIGDLLKQADLAMYQAKALGRNAVCLFDPQMQAVVTANAALDVALRQALRDQEFVLHYQPQVGRDGRMVGVEALVRWQHAERGLVPPDAFIGQAEENGLILPIGRWVLETACAQLAAWSARPETAALTVAVNVSVRQFRHPDFVDLVMTVIEEAGIPASRLKLELTESLLAANIDVTIAKMGVLKKSGVTLSIDDFGMGYSALSYLKYLPLDQLKIDRTFVKDVLTDPNDAAIARTIVGLAQSLGLDVMAEGVETEAQRAFLAWHGCDCYQGYLFCKPLPIDELEVFMREKAATE